MSYFAKVQNGKVINVISAEQDFVDNYEDGIAGKWIQTSYNTYGGVHYNPETGEPSADQSKALRMNYANIGYFYDVSVDAFYAPQPYASWRLNETTYLWEAPVAHPNDGEAYFWNEDTQTWDAVTP